MRLGAIGGIYVVASVAGCGYPELDQSCQAQVVYSDSLLLQEAEMHTENGVTGIIYDGNLTSTDVDRLRIELYTGGQTFGATITPKTVPLTTYQLQGDQCDACVLIAANCHDCTLETGNPQSWFITTGGTLTLTQTSGMLVGTLSNAGFQHVQVDVTNGATSPLNDGCGSQIPSITFAAAIQNK